MPCCNFYICLCACSNVNARDFTEPSFCFVIGKMITSVKCRGMIEHLLIIADLSNFIILMMCTPLQLPKELRITLVSTFN